MIPSNWVASLKRRRLPFLGLVICAAAGICIADRCAVSPLPVALGLIVAGLALLFRPWLPGSFAFTAGVFFLLHTLNCQFNPARLLSREIAGQSVAIRATGVVISEPETKQGYRGSVTTQFWLRTEKLEGLTADSAGAIVLARWGGQGVSYGDRVSLAGTIANIPCPRNPAQFDYAGYLRRLNIYSELDARFPTDCKVDATGLGNALFARAIRARAWMQSKLTMDLQDAPEAAGLVQSLVLGLKRETPENIKELFRRTGTLHLFTVNGLHIGMLATIASFLLRPLRIGRKRAVFIIIPLLIFYAEITGFSTGSIRATIMACVLLGGELFDRRPLSLNSLAGAAFLILARDTNELFMPGFQFSFGVVAAIILLAGPIRSFLSRLWQPDPFLPRELWGRWLTARYHANRWLVQLASVSIAAWIGSIPFTGFYFHLATPSAVLVNLAVVPLAFAILAEGVLALLSAPFWNALVIVFNNANWVLAKFLLLPVVQFFSVLPAGHFYLELPRLSPPTCEIAVFDLGEGGAAHLRAGGRDWLIDTGNKFPYGEIVRPYLRSRGVNRLDGLVITHGSSKDMGGASEALSDFDPRCVIDSPLTDRSRIRKAFEEELQARKTPPAVRQRGDTIQITEKVRLRVLYPPADLIARAADDKALVLLVEAAGSRVLLMSDSGFFTEHWLLEHEPGLRCDIIIKGQHSSDASGAMDFIRAAQPKVIICGTGRFSPSAKISDSWAADVVARGIALFRQDKTGEVSVSLNSGSYLVKSFLDGQTVRGLSGK